MLMVSGRTAGKLSSSRSQARNGKNVSLTICFTSPYSFGRVTGIGRFIRDLRRRLETIGLDSFAISPAPSPPSEGGVEVHLRLPVLANMELAFRTALALFRLRRTYQVLHAQHAHLQSAAAAVIGRVLGKPSILTLHGVVPRPTGFVRRTAQTLSEWLSVKSATRVIAVTDFVQRSFTNIRRGIEVIPNGVDVQNFKPSPQARAEIRRNLDLGSDIVFLFAGRWAITKGVDLLLKAALSTAAMGKHFTLLFLGEPSPENPKLLSMAELPDNLRTVVRVVGPVGESLPSYLAAADIFVLPSLYEGLPMGLLEAMATGVPIIASDIPINKRIITGSGCGWLFRSGDVNDLARVIGEVLSDGIPKDFALRARQAVLRSYSLDEEVARYRTLYLESDHKVR